MQDPASLDIVVGLFPKGVKFVVIIWLVLIGIHAAVNLKSVPRSRSTGVPASPLKLEAVGIAFLPALDIAV